MKQTIDLMAPRFKVIGLYPNMEFFEMGVIIHGDGSFKDGTKISSFPNLFKPLQWWEERSLEDFRSIKYARVTTYRHYWLVGDIVEVTRLYLGSPKGFYGFDLKGKQHAFCDVIPATETDYNNYLKSKS